MSPEQAAGDPLDGRSDLYSLAVVLYYLLAGSTPYKANSAQKLLALAMGGDLPAIKERRKGAPLPDAVEGFVRKALSYHREDRPADVDAWIAELQAAISDAPKSVLEAIPEGAVAPVADQRSITSKRASGSSKSGNAKFSVASQEAQAPASPNRSLMLGACIGLGLLGVIGAVVVFTRPAPASAPVVIARTVEPSKPAEPARPAEPAKPQPPQMATVKVASDPPGASIYDGADLLGVAPASLLLPRSRGGVNLTLKLTGYTPQTQGVDLSKDPEVSVKLVAEAGTPAKPDDGKKKNPHKPTKSDIPVFE
jgi:serine/threonine-protein kinase